MKWKPTNSRSAILAVQRLIAAHPYSIQFKRLFYYVTMSDIAEEVGCHGEILSPELTKKFFERIGLNYNEIHFDSITGESPYAYFVDDLTLRAASQELLPWNFHHEKPINARRQRIRKTSCCSLLQIEPK